MRRLALVTAAVLSTSALVPFAAAAPRCGDEATLTISHSNSLRTTDGADETLHVTNDSSDAVTLTLDDSKGTGTARFDETTVPPNSEEDIDIDFSADGDYTLTLRVATADADATASVKYSVGAPCDTEESTNPRSLAKDIKGIDKEIGKLDRELDKTYKEAESFLKVSSAPSTRPSTPTEATSSRATPPHVAANAEPTERDNSVPGVPAPTPVRSNPQAGHSGAVPKTQAPTPATAKPQKATVPAPRKEAETPAEPAESNPIRPAQITPISSSSDITNFWAGVLAGFGGAFLIFGVGLLLLVARRPKQPEKEETPADTTVIPRVD